MEAEAEPEEEPWKLKLERALLSRLAPASDDDEEEEEEVQIIRPNEEDGSAQLDELMALKSIFGDDLRFRRIGPRDDLRFRRIGG